MRFDFFLSICNCHGDIRINCRYTFVFCRSCEVLLVSSLSECLLMRHTWCGIRWVLHSTMPLNCLPVTFLFDIFQAYLEKYRLTIWGKTKIIKRFLMQILQVNESLKWFMYCYLKWRRLEVICFRINSWNVVK